MRGRGQNRHLAARAALAAGQGRIEPGDAGRIQIALLGPLLDAGAGRQGVAL